MDIAVGGPISHGSPDPYEVRVYSWRGDFFATKRNAADELGRLGFAPTVLAGDSEHYSSWNHPSGLQVYIESGYNGSIREAMRGKQIQDTGAVTVLVSEPISDNVVTKLRLSLEEDW